jgi:hypothetical protein
MYYLAEVLAKQGKTADAERVLTRMGKEVPNTYDYHLELGRSPISISAKPTVDQR